MLSTTAKVTIASNLISMTAVGAAVAGARLPMVLPYEVHKFMHIFGVTLLFGNMMVGPMWFLLAWTSKAPATLAFAARGLSMAELVFTVPGVQMILWNGLAMATAMGGVTSQPWIAQSLMLLVPTWLLGSTLALYWQERVILLAERGEIGAPLTRAMIHWSVWGSVVMVPPSLIAWMMVSKHGIFG
jgi:uncharacterized membrane protein